MCHAASLTSKVLSTIVVRIGWCQPGINLPEQMTAGGSPTTAVPTDSDNDAIRMPAYAPEVLGYDRNDELLRWFHMMWLSNKDMGQLFSRCVTFEANQNVDDDKFIVVNGVSANSKRRWSSHNYDR